MPAVCANCHWGRGTVVPSGIALHCHKTSPQLIVLQHKDGLVRLTEWPPVPPDENCGDHKYQKGHPDGADSDAG